MSFSEKNYRHQVIAVAVEEGKVAGIEAIEIPRVADLMRIPDSPFPRREGEAEERALSYNDLQKIAPLDMLRHTFAVKYGGEFPEEIETLFNEVMREVSL